jgi:hypothetical protein
MFDSQIIIKLFLIAAFILFSIVVVIPSRGSRHLAVRRLALLAVFALGVLTVIFPEITLRIAELVGVERGADLVLYGLVVVFVGNSIFTAAKFRHHERDLTQLARSIALARVVPPVRSDDK